MANISKPVDINKIWATSGDVLSPSDSKISTGWQVEIPPRQYFNYIDNKQDQGIAHINQHGIAVWDNVTEYQYNTTGVKSLCMGSDGNIYRSVSTSINQDPTTDTTDVYWKLAFPNVGDSYTKIEGDGRYAKITSNGSDFTNPATFRTNLSLYSQAEVDAKTTVATALQAQTQTSATALISALALAQSYGGANQNLVGTGHQQFGDFIVNWGTGTSTTSGVVTGTFDKPFTTACFAVVGSAVNSSVYADTFELSALPTKTSFTFAVVSSGAGGASAQVAATVFWIAVGK